MSRPLNNYKFKGYEIADWGDGKLTFKKSYKKKDSDTWVEIKTSIWASDLEPLASLFTQAFRGLGKEPEIQAPQSLPGATPIEYDDSDIPF